MSKFCQYCGQRINEDSDFCPFCSKKLVNEIEAANTENIDGFKQIRSINNIESMNSHTPKVIRNSNGLKVMNASRLFLYNTVTLGIYQIYWFYKNNEVLKNGFNRDIKPVLRTICLFIPILNWIVYYITLSDFRDLLEERRLKSFSVGYNIIFLVLFPVFGLNVFALLNVQEYINDLCMHEDPSIIINREYKSWEKILSLAIPILILLIVFIIFGILMSAITQIFNPIYY